MITGEVDGLNRIDGVIESSFIFPAGLVLRLQVLKRREPSGESPRLIQDQLSDAEVSKNLYFVSRQPAASANRRFNSKNTVSPVRPIFNFRSSKLEVNERHLTRRREQLERQKRTDICWNLDAGRLECKTVDKLGAFLCDCQK
jgi:hypothetical protein